MNSTPEDDTTLCIHFCAHTSKDNASRFINFTTQQITKHRAESLYLAISSAGGDNAGAFMIYQFLTSLQIPVVTHSAGITDSSAVSIFLAGTPRFASPNSRFLIHKPSWTFEAKSQFQAAKLKEFAQQMDWDEETHIAIITERSGIALDKVREWHNTGAIFTGAEAIANGLVDEAREFKRPNRCIQFAN